MSKDTKKPSKVVDAVELSKAQVEYIDNAISYELQVIEMDNIYNKDRASLKKLLVENIALALTDKPSYASWNYIHSLFREGICKVTGMELTSFDKNIWSDIVSILERDYEQVKPKSPKEKTIQKSEQRAKIEAMSDDELKAQGKLVELAKREEKAIKELAKKKIDDHKLLIDAFKENMKSVVKNEPSFALWINANLNTLREQFKAQS